MRKVFIMVFALLAMCGSVLAVGWQPVPCDSTSYYYYHAADSMPLPCRPFWESLVSLAEEPAVEQTPVYIESATKENTAGESQQSASSQRLAASQFSMPANILFSPNPEPVMIKHDRQEFYGKLRKDNTSQIYLAKDVRRLTHMDSLAMFLPFDTRNLNDYTVKQFGVKAKYVEIKNPLPPHFHIDISQEPISEHYPWQVIIPVVLSIVLILLALFFQEGYVGRIMTVVFFHNAFHHRVRERNVNADKSGALLFANYMVNAAILAMVALYRFKYQFSSEFFISFLTLLIILMAVYAVKGAISFAMAHLFDCRDVFELYYRNLSYVMQATGVFLLVVNILSLYVNKQGMHNFFFYTTIVGCAVAEVMKIFRLFKIILDKHFSYFYLFLYLCAVEILPVLLVVKILSR